MPYIFYYIWNLINMPRKNIRNFILIAEIKQLHCRKKFHWNSISWCKYHDRKSKSKQLFISPLSIRFEERYTLGLLSVVMNSSYQCTTIIRSFPIMNEKNYCNGHSAIHVFEMFIHTDAVCIPSISDLKHLSD